MVEFKIDFLVDRSDEGVIAEVQRVAELVAPAVLTQSLFDKHAKISASAVRHRFGGWQSALNLAGLAERYSGQTVSSKMRSQVTKRLTNEELLDILRSVASELGTTTLTTEAFEGRAGVGISIYRSRFGSWQKAVTQAGLSTSNLGRRYSEEDYFDNLANVWTHLGRRPRYSDMNAFPSVITPGGYEARFGSWRRALIAFVEWANQETANSDEFGIFRQEQPSDAILNNQCEQMIEATQINRQSSEDRRKVPLRLRWKVLERDSFTCVICGRSRAKGDDIKLHADHIVAWSRGGKTTLDNLRSLCEECNLGKGNL